MHTIQIKPAKLTFDQVCAIRRKHGKRMELHLPMYHVSFYEENVLRHDRSYTTAESFDMLEMIDSWVRLKVFGDYTHEGE